MFCEADGLCIISVSSRDAITLGRSHLELLDDASLRTNGAIRRLMVNGFDISASDGAACCSRGSKPAEDC